MEDINKDNPTNDIPEDNVPEQAVPKTGKASFYESVNLHRERQEEAKKEEGFYEKVKKIDDILDGDSGENKLDSQPAPTPSNEGLVIVSCSCGQAKTIAVKDINAPVQWKCPKKGCTGRVAVTGKVRKSK